MMKKTPLVLLLAAVLPGITFATAPATPVPSEAELEARKRAVPLPAIEVDADIGDRNAIGSYGKASVRDTPATIAVIGRERLDTLQIRNVSELARQDAAFGDSYAPFGYYQNLAVRGYALDLGTGYRANNLAIAGEQRIAFEDKERVELLKGLAGFGAGVMEPGGLVNFVSKRPKDVRTVTLATDSEGSLLGALDVGGWLGEDFGLRANLAWEDMHSFVRHGNGRRNFHALAADWRITPQTLLELDGNYHTSAQRSVSGWQLLGGERFPEDVDPRQMLGYQPWQAPVAIRSSNLSARLTQHLGDNWNLHLAAGQSRSVIDDDIAFAYACFYQSACNDGSAPGNYFAPNGDYDIYDYRSPDDTRVTRDLRLRVEGVLGHGDVVHELSFGIEGFHRDIHRHASVNAWVGAGNIAEREPPVYTPSPKQPGPLVRRADSWQRSFAALDRVRVGDAWQILAGARRVEIDDRAWSKRAVLERATRRGYSLPQLAVMWQPLDAVTGYLSYAEGVSLGKEAPYWASNDGESLAPRLSRQWETGLRLEWNDALRTDASFYRIEQPNQFARPDASAAGFTFVESGREVHHGIELAAHGRLTEGLRIDASIDFNRARVEGSGVAAFDGTQVVNVPRVRSTIALEYALRARPELAFRAGWRHAAANPATPDGRIRAPAYDVFDAGVHWRGAWREHRFAVHLGVDNLFNRFYWRDTGSVSGDSYLFPGAPRIARLSVEMAF